MNYLTRADILLISHHIETDDAETLVEYIKDKELIERIEKVARGEIYYSFECNEIKKEEIQNLAKQIRKEDYDFLKERINQSGNLYLLCATGDIEYINLCLGDESLNLNLEQQVFLIIATRDANKIKTFLKENFLKLDSWNKTKLIESTNDIKYIKKCLKNESLKLSSFSKVELIRSTKDVVFIKQCIEDQNLSLFNPGKVELIESTKNVEYIKSFIDFNSLKLQDELRISLIKSTQDDDYTKTFIDDENKEFSKEQKFELIKKIKDIEYIKEYLKHHHHYKDISRDNLIDIIALTKDEEYIKTCMSNSKLKLSINEKTKLILRVNNKNLMKEYLKTNKKELSKEEIALFQLILKPNKLKLKNNEYKKIDLPKNMTIGIEIESEGRFSQNLPKTISNGYWEAKSDDSLTNGIELVSKILTESEKDSKEIYSICNVLNNIGQVTTERCGAHVHIGAAYLKSIQAYINLLEIVGNTEKIIYIISNKPGENIRNGVKEFFSPISSKLESSFEDGKIKLDYDDLYKFTEELQMVQESKYKAVNFINVGNHKNTIEFRTANGTINPDIWIENINLFGGIIKASEEIAQIQQKTSEELTLEDQEKLQMMSKLKDEKTTDQEKLDILLSLSVKDKEPYINRFESNYSFIKKDEKMLKGTKTKRGSLDIQRLGRETLEEQNDTVAKISTMQEIEQQIAVIANNRVNTSEQK